jgi:hypothetical protein
VVSQDLFQGTLHPEYVSLRNMEPDADTLTFDSFDQAAEYIRKTTEEFSVTFKPRGALPGLWFTVWEMPWKDAGQ